MSPNTDWKKEYSDFAASKWKQTELSKDEEKEFLRWLSSSEWFGGLLDIVRQENPMITPSQLLNDVVGPQSDYDYRGAWKEGVGAKEYEYDGLQHWPSSTESGAMLKSPQHPTAWMEFFMNQYGRDPNELGLRTFPDAVRWERGHGLLSGWRGR